MKFKYKTVVTVDAIYLKARLGIRYWDEDVFLNGEPVGDGEFPGRDGDDWNVIIDLDSGVIQDWPQGATANVDAKVADDGDYYLLDDTKQVVYSREAMYVPRILGGGDYVSLIINAQGKIYGWCPDLEDFENTED
jgi:hypothetical protein